MTTVQPPEAVRSSAAGAAFLLPAYLIWGLSPLYWKLLAHVSSFELLMHRTIWSLAFLALILTLQKRGKEILAVFAHLPTLARLSATTTILALNWYLFIWAINHDHVLQASLAYYINPLIMVFFGMVFFKERLNLLQITALVIAGAGVGYYTIFLGEFPWVSIVIAITFALYGLAHKKMAVLPLPGLFIETLILSLPAGGWLIWSHIQGQGAMSSVNLSTDLLLVGTCLVTGLPLLIFTIGAKRSSMTTVGFMQYIAPSCTFLLAVLYYGEPFSAQKLAAFIMIWIALVCYSVDSFRVYRGLAKS